MDLSQYLGAPAAMSAVPPADTSTGQPIGAPQDPYVVPAAVPQDPYAPAPAAPSVNAYLGQPAFAPQTSPPLAPPGMTPPSEAPGPTPSGAPGAGPSVGDYLSGRVALPSTPQQVDTANKAYDAQQAKLAAANNNPFLQAFQQQKNALQQKQDIAVAQGDVAAQQAASEKAILDKRNADADAARVAADRLAESRIAEEQKRQTDIDTMVNNAASMKVDPNRYWNSRDTGQKILGSIAVLLGGIGAGFTGHGASNVALDMIKDSINRDVESQTKNIEQYNKAIGLKKDSLAHYHQLTNDMNQAAQLKVAEGYKRAADQLEAMAKGYAGPQAQLTAKAAAADLRGQAGALQNQVAKEAQDRADKQRELGLQVNAQAMTERHFNAQQAQAQKFHDDEIALQYGKLLQEGKDKQAAELKTHQEQLNNNGIMGVTGTTTDANGNLVPKYEYLKQQDGSDYIMPKEADKIVRPAYAGTTQAVNALDELRKLRSENGGDVNKWGVDARTKAQQLERALVGMHKASGITGFRGNVMDVMEKQLTGGADPASVFQSVEPLLDSARKNLVDDLHTVMTKEGNYTGKPIQFPDPLKASKPAESAEKQMRRPLETVVPAGDSPVPSLSDVNNPETERARSNGMFPHQQAIFDMWGRGLESDDPEAVKDAERHLVWAEKNAATSEMRDYARKTLGDYLRPKLSKIVSDAASNKVAGP